MDEALIEAMAWAMRSAGLGWLHDHPDPNIGWADVPDEVFARACAPIAYKAGLERALVLAGASDAGNRISEEMRRVAAAIRKEAATASKSD